MASQTPIHKLPYPNPGDVPDIAGDIQKLATAVDGMLGTVSSGGAYDPITTYATNFARASTPPRPLAWHRAGPFVSFEIFPNRTTSNLTGSTNGDLTTDVQIGTLATQIPRPINQVSAVNTSWGPLAGLYLLPDGTLWIGNIAPSASWVVGVVWNMSFFYMAAV